ncbi:MAG: MerR family transcriptional regulator [Candidatus Eisenbacteria bacterium]|uniref:MerR family transcriptional regulator n=1 Tax=Eiseniibacteriota bacterium TaxID=2212470 RepID=A0A948RYT6_UNCEI|nr:MerR family transcriptional regulator [Candidatus Eisenbacteria bacterium]MBU1949455.1 MerR family transcriptional regulator [Candidatus Eisenbacteria bacterium]MBU2691632.1 MerR family transcriptional regulator [Candidatus Eisenbacteria bacterium]
MTIGEVAHMAGVNIQTMRYYERRGIVPKPPRRTSGYRAYPLDTVLLVRFIKRAQDLGFTLDEVLMLLSFRNVEESQREETAIRASDVIRIIDAKATRMAAMKAVLDQLVFSCREGRAIEPCPIVEVVNEIARGNEPPAPPATRNRKRGRRKV